MKKTIITSGFPHVFQAYASIVDAFTEAIRNVILPFGNCIVSGFEQTGYNAGTQTYTYSAGVVFFNGEPVAVPAHSVVLTGGQQLYFNKQTINVSNFPVSHADGEVKTMVIEKIGKVVSAADPGDDLQLLSTLKRWVNTDWTVVVPGAGYDFSGIADSLKLSYKVVNGEFIMRGRIRRTGAVDVGGDLKMFTIPVGLRPLIQKFEDLQNYVDSSIRADTNGDVIINHGTPYAAPRTYNIPDFRYRID